jgi:YHS domain-containing protein
VSGVAFDVKESSARHDLDGKTLYFCCEGCAGYFAENRARVTAARNLAR